MDFLERCAIFTLIGLEWSGANGAKEMAMQVHPIVARSELTLADYFAPYMEKRQLKEARRRRLIASKKIHASAAVIAAVHGRRLPAEQRNTTKQKGTET
jgi:hypothetical protein